MVERRLEIEGLRQRLYDPARGEQFIVNVDMNITLLAGDFVALLGPSGCGKTTLLSVLGLLRAPTELTTLKRFSLWVPQADKAEVELDLKRAWQRGHRRTIEQIRRRHIGFSLQSGELISSLTVQENISVPLHLNGLPSREVARRVTSLIDAFQLRRRHDSNGSLSPTVTANIAEDAANESKRHSSLARASINRLSGGEYQRVALARAIAHRPTIAFVDEPTSALNRELARGSLSLLKQLQSGERQDGPAGVTVMITHDESFAAEFSNVIIRMAPRRGEAAGDVVEVTRLHDPKCGVSPATEMQEAIGHS